MRLKVTAWLERGLAGDPPHFDAIVEHEMAFYRAKARPLARDHPAPSPHSLRSPVHVECLGGHRLAWCSSPILPVAAERHDHIAKQFGVENSDLLHPAERTKIHTGSSVHKSYRVPLRVRHVDRVVWFVEGGARGIRRAIRDVESVGKKRADGYGVVTQWDVERFDDTWHDRVPPHLHWTWVAPAPDGRLVLLRPLPYGPWLPENLTGYRRGFGACQPPYWHPDRFMEIVLPC